MHVASPHLHVQHTLSEPMLASGKRSRVSSCASEALNIFVGGVGLLADSYDFAVINLVRHSIAKLYPVTGNDWDGSWQRSLITASSIFGAMAGQLLLGYLADHLGRRKLLLLSGGLTFLGAVGSASAFDFGANHDGLWLLLISWRFVMGVGIGGVTAAVTHRS